MNFMRQFKMNIPFVTKNQARKFLLSNQFNFEISLHLNFLCFHRYQIYYNQ